MCERGYNEEHVEMVLKENNSNQEKVNWEVLTVQWPTKSQPEWLKVSMTTVFHSTRKLMISGQMPVDTLRIQYQSSVTANKVTGGKI